MFKLMKKLLITLLFFISFQFTFSQIISDTLIIAYTPAPPFIVENEEKLEGINIWLWEQIASDLNLQYRLVPMDFSEMLVAVQKGTIDISINPLTITSDRSKKMEFTHSFFASNSTIAIVKSSSIQKFFKFLKSFFYCWISTIFII